MLLTPMGHQTIVGFMALPLVLHIVADFMLRPITETCKTQKHETAPGRLPCLKSRTSGRRCRGARANAPSEHRWYLCNSGSSSLFLERPAWNHLQPLLQPSEQHSRTA